MREIFLIDGNSLVYRAFFALPESIATSTGEPTNAIFGFASMLVKLVTDHGVKPTIVAWDAGTSGRTEVYPEYKAQRQSRPSLLKAQWPAFEPLVEAFGYRNVRVAGYEADDVLASMAEQSRAAGISTTIVTGDRDAFQLVDEAGIVKVMATSRGITDTVLYDHQAVVDRYGLVPALIPDFYGLKGDTSDNIPGVPGIGEKTASELLARFGTLESVLEHVEEINGPKRRENLVRHSDDARVSKELATMKRTVELPFTVVEAVAAEPDRSTLRAFFRRYELRDPLRRLEEALGSAEAAAPPPTADEQLSARVRHGDLGQLARFAGRGGELSVALRAPEVPEGALFGASELSRFGVCAGDEVMVGACEDGVGLVEALGDGPVVAHDAKSLGAVPAGLVHDTMLGAYLLEPARRGYPLGELCEERGLASTVEDAAGGDALLVRALADRQRTELTERGLMALLQDVELPLVRVLRKMEVEGVRLNIPRLAAITDRVREEVAFLERRIYDVCGEEFTIGSPQQLGEILFVKLGLSRKRRGKTGFSTDARVLASIRHEHEIIVLVERWRELSTLVKTYLEPLPELVDGDSRLHTTFLQGGGHDRTSVIDESQPPERPDPNAARAGDPRLLRGGAGAAAGLGRLLAGRAPGARPTGRRAGPPRDLPCAARTSTRRRRVSSTGSAPDELDAGMRSKAKMVNYGIVYGLTDFGLADRLNIPRTEAAEIIKTYLERFPKVREFIETTIAEATDRGHVTTLLGRRRQIPELKARNYQQRTLGERLAVNTVIQGSAADIIKVAMVATDRALDGLETKLILQIHDELLFEGPPEEVDRVREIVVREMTGAWELDPPLVVDIGVGENWLAAK